MYTNDDLIEAAEMGQLAIVKACIAQGLDFDAVNSEGWSALKQAAQRGDVAMVQVLLAAGVDVNAHHPVTGTALYVAAYYGHSEIVHRLLRVPGIVVNATSAQYSALCVAAIKGERAIVNALMMRHDLTEVSALGVAAYCGNLATVQALLAMPDCKINEKNYIGWTALHWAILGGDFDTISLLLAHEAVDLNLQDADGKTVLHRAVGDVRIVTALLTQGIDVNVEDKEGMTALYLAAKDNHIETVKILRRVPGIVVNTPYNPLIVAVEQGYIFIVRELLSVPGINVNMSNKDGNTALMRAVSRGRLVVVQALLSVPGLDPQACLPVAITHGKLGIVKALVAAGATITPKLSVSLGQLCSHQAWFKHHTLEATDYENYAWFLNNMQGLFARQRMENIIVVGENQFLAIRKHMFYCLAETFNLNSKNNKMPLNEWMANALCLLGTVTPPFSGTEKVFLRMVCIQLANIKRYQHFVELQNKFQEEVVQQKQAIERAQVSQQAAPIVFNKIFVGKSVVSSSSQKTPKVLRFTLREREAGQGASAAAASGLGGQQQGVVRNKKNRKGACHVQ